MVQKIPQSKKIGHVHKMYFPNNLHVITTQNKGIRALKKAFLTICKKHQIKKK